METLEQAAERCTQEHRLASFIGVLLRTGVMIAFIIVLAGGVLYLMHYGRSSPQYHVFAGEPSDLRSVPGIAGDAFTGRSRGIIQFGLLVLIATPIARVALSAIAFALQKDRMYVVFTCIVLGILVLSLSGHAI